MSASLPTALYRLNGRQHVKQSQADFFLLLYHAVSPSLIRTSLSPRSLLLPLLALFIPRALASPTRATTTSADLDLDLDIDLPPSSTIPLVRRALPSACTYTCPASTLPNFLGLSLTLLPGSSGVTGSTLNCAYVLGLLGNCSYDVETGALIGTGANLTGQCVGSAVVSCQAGGARSVVRKRQRDARIKKRREEAMRPARRSKDVPQELEARKGLWKNGREGKLGAGKVEKK